MNRKQFTFYRSFWEGIKEIKSVSARCAVYDAIVGYALDGVEPALEKLPDAARIAFKLAKPNLDAARKKAEGGAKSATSTLKDTDKMPSRYPQQEKEQEKDKEQVKEQVLYKADSIATAWNALGLSQITKISGSSPRGKMLKARIAEYGEDAVFKAIDNIRNSSFLRGQNDRGWTITFDWFVKPTNFVKVLEGNYTDKTQTKTVETRKGVAYGGELDSSVVRSAYERLLQEESA